MSIDVLFSWLFYLYSACIPFIIVFTAQMLCRLFVRHKLLRQLPVLFCIFFFLMTVISQFLSGYDGMVFASFCQTCLVESIIGYAGAWAVQGIVLFIRNRKTADYLS
ncbi:MAG: hypothetical protein IJH07_10965 [Ruminococcus sp.]|nr:hypothetical protein [Ruminococcus sp.]